MWGWGVRSCGNPKFKVRGEEAFANSFQVGLGVVGRWGITAKSCSLGVVGGWEMTAKS